MNILWLTNVALPEASVLMNEKATPFGGWFVSASAVLAEKDDIELSVAFPKNGLNDVLVLIGGKIKFYVFPPVNEKEISAIKRNKYFAKILNEVKPDIVHIFGTEYAHSLAMVNVCHEQNEKIVISIQGLTSIIPGHYLTGLPSRVQNRFTFRDLLKQDNLKQQQSKFIKRGAMEIEALQKVTHVIGRTTWDKVCTNQINPDVHYHFCNEILRDKFYNHTWRIDQCERYSIFVSQGSYPIKGLHFMLEAMPLILKRFANAMLYIGGQNITKTDNFIDKLKISSYGRYIKELIEEFNLKENVVFTGILDEQKMCERHLKSHVFVSPSLIENESNSLSEAKLMGVPCVASYAGGVTDRIEHCNDGFFYQHDASYMLAHYITRIFADDELAVMLSSRARVNALKMYNKDKNTDTLIQVYKEILQA